MKEAVLVLTASSGLGGGIERVADAVVDALAASGATWTNISLQSKTDTIGAGGSHLRLLKLASQWVSDQKTDVRVIVLHRSLLPTAAWLASRKNVSDVKVMLYGIDVWGSHRVEMLLLRHPAIRPIAISGFTAGAVGVRTPAAILHPPIEAAWYETLCEAARQHREAPTTFRVMTSFRLPSWRSKGLDTLVAALKELGHPTQLVVCGSGSIQPELRALIDGLPGAEIKNNLSDIELAAEFRAADLFVLATKTRRGKAQSGEGFGLVLSEAQLAGTAVIAPAYGGSSDTFIEGYSGHSPNDESPAALASLINRMLDDDYRATIARNGQRLAVEYFAPDAQRARIAERLLQQ